MKRLSQYILFVLLFIINALTPSATIAASKVIDTSRASCVQVIVPSIAIGGTGFFIDEQHVVTCFHVVCKMDINLIITPAIVTLNVGKDVAVALSSGEIIQAEIVAPATIPQKIKVTDSMPLPISVDFAILRLRTKPKSSIIPLPLFKGTNLPPIGSEVVFSGYPLGAPTMLTHTGVISGITNDMEIICIQAPINKGNSGGALLNENGEVIGIISNREGGLNSELQRFIQADIKAEMVANGIGTFSVIQDLAKTLDQYISTGIGYARNIKYVNQYINQFPDVIKPLPVKSP